MGPGLVSPLERPKVCGLKVAAAALIRYVRSNYIIEDSSHLLRSRISWTPHGVDILADVDQTYVIKGR